MAPAETQIFIESFIESAPSPFYSIVTTSIHHDVHVILDKSSDTKVAELTCAYRMLGN